MIQEDEIYEILVPVTSLVELQEYQIDTKCKETVDLCQGILIKRKQKTFDEISDKPKHVAFAKKKVKDQRPTEAFTISKTGTYTNDQNESLY